MVKLFALTLFASILFGCTANSTSTQGAIPPPAYCQDLRGSSLWETTLALVETQNDNKYKDGMLELDETDLLKMLPLVESVPTKTLQVSVEFIEKQVRLALSDVSISPEILQQLVVSVEEVDSFGVNYCKFNKYWTLIGFTEQKVGETRFIDPFG